MTETTIWWIVGAFFLGHILGRIRRGGGRLPTPTFSDDAVPPDTLRAVDEALARGRKIEAIKLLREGTGTSLYDAKAFIEARGMPVRRKGDPIE